MALRINHNIAAMNGHRNLLENDQEFNKTLERLSSGLKINRAADGAAALIISEQIRAQIKGLNQAVDNSETAISMVQTTEAALSEVTNLLVGMRQLAIHAANEGANDRNMLEADQLELKNGVETIDRIAKNAQFGVKKLLDGSTAANGVGIGTGLEFIGATADTRSSPIEGYEVRVQRLGTQARKRGTVALTQEMVDRGEEFTIAEGGKTVSLTTQKGDSVSQAIGKLNNEIKQIGLAVDLSVDKDGTIELRHKQFGSRHTFSVSSSTAGVLSSESRRMEAAAPGQDIAGTIGGDAASGDGQVLAGGQGTKVQGLKVRYTGNVVTSADAGEGAEAAGRVAVYQNSPVFQIGGNAGQSVAVSLVNTNTAVLGRGVPNEGGFRSLREVDLRTEPGAVGTQRLVDRALDEVNSTRAELGAFQKNSLEANLRQLRINVQELTSAESVIRDADMAEEITRHTRDSIAVQSATAMLAQANQAPKAVLALLG